DATAAPWLTLERHISVLRGMWEQRPLDLLAQLDLPVLLVPADSPGDSWGPAKREAVDRAGAALRRGRVAWMAGDHDLHAQHPREVAALIAEWAAT
ncbi:MAG: alpha/beta fold hydrolase, partial [Mycobacteriales bacterium]